MYAVDILMVLQKLSVLLCVGYFVEKNTDGFSNFQLEKPMHTFLFSLLGLQCIRTMAFNQSFCLIDVLLLDILGAQSWLNIQKYKTVQHVWQMNLKS